MEDPTPPAPNLLAVAIYGSIGIIAIGALLAWVIASIVGPLAFFPTYIVLLLAGAAILALRLGGMIAARKPPDRDREGAE